MAPVKFPPSVRVGTLADLKAELLHCLESGGELVLDGTATERIDTAGLQLLLAALLEAKKGQSHVLLRCSPALEEAFRVAGVDPADWAEVSA